MPRRLVIKRIVILLTSRQHALSCKYFSDTLKIIRCHANAKNGENITASIMPKTGKTNYHKADDVYTNFPIIKRSDDAVPMLYAIGPFSYDS